MPQPRLYVDQRPTFTPLPFGLLSSLGTEIRTPTDPHWQLGVTYEPLCGASSTTYEECFTVTGSGLSPAGAPPLKTDTGGLDKRGATAFTVFSEVDCSAPGFWQRAEETVAQLLTQSEQWQVERAIWTGQTAGHPAVYPRLAANAEVVEPGTGIVMQLAAGVVTGAALDVVEGIGRLEASLSDCYDGVGILHVPVELAPAMANANLLVREGPRYRTPKGSIVVLGAGYPGTAPDGLQPVGSVYVYATGALMILRSRPTVMPLRSTLDRSKNTVKAIAERTYVIGWDCCLHAVNITLGGVVSGTFNSGA